MPKDVEELVASSASGSLAGAVVVDFTPITPSGNPIRFSRTKVSYDKAPPALGADSDTIREWLANHPLTQDVLNHV